MLVDDVLRSLKELASGDAFSAEKTTETWQKCEPIIWTETASEINFSSLPCDHYFNNFRSPKATLNKTELGALNEVFSYQGSFPYINIFTITGAGNIVCYTTDFVIFMEVY